MFTLSFSTSCPHGLLKRRIQIVSSIMDSFRDLKSEKCIMYERGEDEIILIFPLMEEGSALEETKKRNTGLDLCEYVHEPGDESLCPTMCFPDAEMSDTTLAEYLSEEVPEDEYLDRVALTVTTSVFSCEDRSSAKLVEFGRRTGDLEIKAMINFIVGGKPFPGITPVECTQFELQSRMMLLDEEAHMEYRSFLSHLKIEKMVECYEPDRRVYLENHISDIIHVNLMCITVVVDNKHLWHFGGGRWRKDTSGSYLWNLLSSDFLSNSILKAREIVDDITSYLGSVSVRTRIMTDLQYKLYDGGFSERLDARTDVIGMQDKVFDLKNHCLRKALPGDYVSMVCKTPGVHRKKMETLERILDTIFPDPSVRKFFMRSCSSILEGYNKYKVFFIWKGNGNNAKSLVQRLISESLGDYYSTAPTSLITRKRGTSSAATPELSSLEGRLAVFLQEPNPDEKIQVGQIKELTGNDHMYVRDLYKPPRNIKIKAKFFIVTNSAMDAPNMDLAFRRRLVVIPFESTFLGEEDYNRRVDKENCHIIDPEIEECISQYADVFMSMLTSEYKEFKMHGLEMPESVRQATEDYIVSNNHCLRFIRTHLTHESGSEEAIEDVYHEFKEWSKSTMPGGGIVSMVGFLREIKLDGMTVSGERIRNVTLIGF